VIVIDGGEPRNAPAEHVHGYLGHEGLPPAELMAIGRDEVRSYGAEVLAGQVLQVSRTDDDHLRVELASGHAIVARRVVAATGLVDELPDIEGLAPLWGSSVIHCPFCHGYEVRDRRIVQIITHPMGLHAAGLFRQLTDDLHLVVHDGVEVDAAELDVLRAAGIEVTEAVVRRIVTDDVGDVESVELAGGERLAADVVAIGPRFRVRAEPFAALGLRPVPHASGLGDVIEANAMGVTSVVGVYAAGNLTDPSQQVLHAAANGTRVGAMVSSDLAQADLRAAARPSANEADWDVRYGDEPLWSGNPNGSLVAEVSGVTPGRALDVGAGEGGDAVWLAEQGWKVVASDISTRALDRIGAEAGRRGLAVEPLHVDANALEPFPIAAFDLVTAHYASIPRTPDDRAVHNLLAAVAPGGTLLVVSHDIEAMHAAGGARAFDPDAYVQVADFAAALADAEGWHIDVHEKRHRPPGAASAAHHVEDVIFRARRRTA
jgi:thioredoxin reductase/SAM-dependent methyltransferase